MLKKLLVLSLLLFSSSLFAQDSEAKKYSAKVYYGYADEKDFGEILTLQGARSPIGTSIAGFDVGYLFSHNTWNLPIDFYVKAGYARYFENGYQDDLNELNALIKLYYNIDLFYDNQIRIGFGEGGSYVWGIPTIEKLEAQAEQPPKNSKYLNYIDVSIDFDIGKLIRYEPLKEAYFGYSLKHRSGIFGLINGVRKGGSNYNTLYLEMKF